MQTFQMAIKAIQGNKARTLLTMLGIIIGVLSVVVLIGIGQGTTMSVTASIEGMGTNLLTVNITSRQGGGGTMANRAFSRTSTGQQTGTVHLTLSDILQLEENESIAYISPVVSGSLTTKAGNVNRSTNITGVLPAYALIRNQGVQSGRYLLPYDIDNRSAVAVVGVDTATALYGNTDVVNNTLYVDGRPFRIVGVLSSKGSASSGSNDDVVIIPFTLAQRMLKSTAITSFYASAVNADSVSLAQGAIENYLYKRYQDENSYSVMNQTEMLSTIEETTSSLTLMLGGIAGISLLVGGIGIMNIMLVSVTERTKEIGIRKAIGAKRRDILSQFLIEAVIISGIGGLLGLCLGYALMQVLEQALGMSAVFSASVVQLSLSFSISVGVIFGLYPAAKAAKLRPIEALRYD
ncbi:MAG TPA: ABC transporter permease [Clostridia bacterium]|nr:ABC transporter permease [Clostridia bacterium]